MVIGCGGGEGRILVGVIGWGVSSPLSGGDQDGGKFSMGLSGQCQFQLRTH